MSVPRSHVPPQQPIKLPYLSQSPSVASKKPIGLGPSLSHLRHSSLNHSAGALPGHEMPLPKMHMNQSLPDLNYQSPMNASLQHRPPMPSMAFQKVKENKFLQDRSNVVKLRSWLSAKEEAVKQLGNTDWLNQIKSLQNKLDYVEKMKQAPSPTMQKDFYSSMTSSQKPIDESFLSRRTSMMESTPQKVSESSRPKEVTLPKLKIKLYKQKNNSTQPSKRAVDTGLQLKRAICSVEIAPQQRAAESRQQQQEKQPTDLRLSTREQSSSTDYPSLQMTTRTSELTVSPVKRPGKEAGTQISSQQLPLTGASANWFSMIEACSEKLMAIHKSILSEPGFDLKQALLTMVAPFSTSPSVSKKEESFGRMETQDTLVENPGSLDKKMTLTQVGPTITTGLLDETMKSSVPPLREQQTANFGMSTLKVKNEGQFSTFRKDTLTEEPNESPTAPQLSKQETFARTMNTGTDSRGLLNRDSAGNTDDSKFASPCFKLKEDDQSGGKGGLNESSKQSKGSKGNQRSSFLGQTGVIEEIVEDTASEPGNQPVPTLVFNKTIAQPQPAPQEETKEAPLPKKEPEPPAPEEKKKKTPFAGVQLQSLLDAMLKNKAAREEREAEEAKMKAEGITPPPKPVSKPADGGSNPMMDMLRNGLMKQMKQAKKEVEVKKFQQMLKEETDPEKRMKILHEFEEKKYFQNYYGKISLTPNADDRGKPNIEEMLSIVNGKKKANSDDEEDYIPRSKSSINEGQGVDSSFDAKSIGLRSATMTTQDLLPLLKRQTVKFEQDTSAVSVSRANVNRFDFVEPSLVKKDERLKRKQNFQKQLIQKLQSKMKKQVQGEIQKAMAKNIAEKK